MFTTTDAGSLDAVLQAAQQTLAGVVFERHGLLTLHPAGNIPSPGPVTG